MLATKRQPVVPRGPAEYRILLVDDHALIREGFSSVINNAPDLSVCGEAESEQDALKKVEQLAPDLVILDLSLKDGYGFGLIQRLHRKHPEIQILVCSMHEESLFAERVIASGARGYVCKAEGIPELVSAVRCVLRGEIYVSKAMQQRLLMGGMRGQRQTGSPLTGLTERQFEVFLLISKGMKKNAIAECLSISVKTVESHREHIKQRLKLNNIDELMLYAAQWQLEQR